jgi:hypothetical protein
METTNIYLVVNNHKTGPYTTDQVKQMCSSGSISANSLYWHEGMADWVPLHLLVGASAQNNSHSPAIPTSTARLKLRWNELLAELRSADWRQIASQTWSCVNQTCRSISQGTKSAWFSLRKALATRCPACGTKEPGNVDSSMVDKKHLGTKETNDLGGTVNDRYLVNLYFETHRHSCKSCGHTWETTNESRQRA